jgi:hypothetical protein
MKRKVALLLVTVIISIVMGTNSVFCGESHQTNIAEYYNIALDEKIDQCLSKANLKESKSAVLRDCAALEMEKAAFLSANKSELIEGLLEQKIGKKMYKIDFYLNKEFFDRKRELAETESTGGDQKN